MINRNTFSRYSIAALLAAVAAAPTFAQAGACGGPRVAWGSTSTTLGNINCGQLASRGSSFGGFRSLPGTPTIPFSLSVRLTRGLHASGIPYSSGGFPISGCNPIDNSTADGAKTVEGIGCIGGSQHQVIVVF